jgi:pimeloyl-ACP methyl ester carboxylesterase
MPDPSLSIDRTQTQWYTWQGYRCAYDHLTPPSAPAESHPPLLLIQPIGVGLSRHFWQRFCREWFATGQVNSIYNPDLLGCGESAMPAVAYPPEDWSAQLAAFLQTVVQRPAIVIVQGASLPIAVDLVQQCPDLIRGLVLAGPPTLSLINRTTSDWQHRLLWNLLTSPLGTGFYRYARRSQFLQSFSERQLFASPQAVDSEWLEMLQQGATDLASRYAVFSFLAGFWQQDYRQRIAHIQQPTLVVMGEQATSISRRGNQETPDERLAAYVKWLPQAEGVKIGGRNVLPYEVTAEFVSAIAPFVGRL